jgi:hypothetical protein
MVFLAECGFQLNPCVDLVMNSQAVEETCWLWAVSVQEEYTMGEFFADDEGC